jgi:hypothetical protein
MLKEVTASGPEGLRSQEPFSLSSRSSPSEGQINCYLTPLEKRQWLQEEKAKGFF